MSSGESNAYQKLVELSTELQLLKNTQALLGWDQEVLLPKKGVAYRGQQMSWLSGYLHREFTSEKVGDWIAEAESTAATPEENANLREWRHEYDRATKVPVELVQRFAETQVRAKAVWAEAREKSDFSRFAPELQNLIDLSREQAECWGYEGCLYDALLDTYERGMTCERLDETLGGLRDDLVPLVEEACNREPFDQSKLEGDYPVEQQKALNRLIAEDIGFDFEAGRIDTAVHPFCSGMSPFDTRLTTRYDESDFRSSLFGVLHEAGHGMYEQGLREDWHGQPIGQAVSLGIHESQSRLWENQVGRSRAFWEKWLPVAAEHFPHLANLSVDEMFEAVNQASKSFIRVEADEVTYDLHILLRYEMEKEIFAGNLSLQDIPGEWNRRFEEYFGLKVDKDSNGCLQDIHWSMAIFGYFPTYSLGNINAAHLAAAAKADEPGLSSQLEKADYSGLLRWMRKNVHENGSVYLPDDLIQKATGTSADPAHLVAHLRERYL